MKRTLLAVLIIVFVFGFAGIAVAQSPVETPTPEVTLEPPTEVPTIEVTVAPSPTPIETPTAAPSETPMPPTATPVPVPPPPPPPFPPPVDLTPGVITVVLAGALSLILKYVPGLSSKWAELDESVKQSIYAVAAILIGVVIYVLACTPGSGLPFVACPVGGVWSLFATLIATLITGFGLNGALPDKPSVKEAKARAKARRAQQR